MPNEQAMRNCLLIYIFTFLLVFTFSGLGLAQQTDKDSISILKKNLQYSDNNQQKLLIHKDLAYKYLSARQLDSALKYINLAIELNEDKHLDTEGAYYYYWQKAMILHGFNNFTESKKNYELALSKAKKVPRSRLNEIQLNYYSLLAQNNQKGIIPLMTQLCNDFDTTTLDQKRAYILARYLLARSYANEKNTAIAAEIIIDLLQRPDSLLVYISFALKNSLGFYLDELKNYDASISYFKKALQDPYIDMDSAMVVSNIAHTFLDKMELDSALYYCDATEKARGLSPNDDLKITYLRAKIFLKKHQLKKAAYFLAQAKKKNLTNNDLKYARQLQFLEVSLLAEKGELAQALKLLRQIKPMGINQQDYLQDLVSIQKLELYIRLKEINPIIANDFNLLNARQDSLSDLIAQNQTIGLILKYETEKKDAQIELQNQKLKLKNEMAIRQKWTIAGLTGISALALLFLGLVFRQKKQKDAHNRELDQMNQQLLQYNQKLEAQNQHILQLNADIHHRNKNNLSLLAGILSMQSRRTNHPESKKLLEENYGRVMAFANLDNLLLQSKEDQKVNIRQFIDNIIDSARTIFDLAEKSILFQNNTNKQLELNPQHVLSLGIIVNELITNSIKHGFAHQVAPLITIDIQASGSNIKLYYKDNGVGLLQGQDIFSTQSFGMKMINLLSQQLKGQVKAYSREGFIFELKFPYQTNES